MDVSFFRKLPKVDLHCHLDGSLRPDTIVDLAVEQGHRLPTLDPLEIKKYVQVDSTCRSLTDFLKVFHVFYPLLRNPLSVERVAYELMEDSAKENIRYVEVRFAPALQSTEKFTIPEVIASALRGLRRGREKFGVGFGLIICLFRSHSVKENHDTFLWTQRFFGHGVVAMDLAGDELLHPTGEFAEFFEEARRQGIPSTCHAGETKGTENIRSALELGVTRIGHGTNLKQNPKLMEEIIRKRVPLEVGLTSNVRTQTVFSYETHPLRDFYRAHIPVTLNTDDRGVLDIDLSGEYAEAAKLGFSAEDLRRIALNGVEALFLAPSEKDRLRVSFEREWKEALELVSV